jgi:hypothetical protein
MVCTVIGSEPEPLDLEPHKRDAAPYKFLVYNRRKFNADHGQLRATFFFTIQSAVYCRLYVQCRSIRSSVRTTQT